MKFRLYIGFRRIRINSDHTAPQGFWERDLLVTPPRSDPAFRRVHDYGRTRLGDSGERVRAPEFNNLKLRMCLPNRNSRIANMGFT